MSASGLRPVQRVAAHAVVRDDRGRVLVVPVGPGVWSLPGGVVRHGEHPRDTALRRLREQGGPVGRARRSKAVPRTATADLVDLPDGAPDDGLAGPVALHTLRLVFDVAPAGAAHLPARYAEPAELPLMPFAAEVLGVPTAAGPFYDPSGPAPALPNVEPVPFITDLADPEPDPGTEPGDIPADETPVRLQRPAAYAVLVDDGRILLTHLAQSEGTWTLPGGGLDHGEHPEAGLVRELHEETGLPLVPGLLIDIGSRHFVGRAPQGRLEDFHGIRLVYTGSVPTDVEPHVVEVGGSTDAARWVPLGEVGRLRTVATVRESLRIWTERFG